MLVSVELRWSERDVQIWKRISICTDLRRARSAPSDALEVESSSVGPAEVLTREARSLMRMYDNVAGKWNTGSRSSLDLLSIFSSGRGQQLTIRPPKIYLFIYLFIYAGNRSFPR